jgi:hypothetical protein
MTSLSGPRFTLDHLNPFKPATLAFVYRQDVGQNGNWSAGCFNKNVPVWFLGTKFEARNCISESGPQEHYRDMLTCEPIPVTESSQFCYNQVSINLKDKTETLHDLLCH